LSIAAAIGGVRLPVSGTAFVEDVGMTDPTGAVGDGDVGGLRSAYLKTQLVGHK